MDNTAEEARGETAPNPEKSSKPESKPGSKPGSKLESKPEYKPQFQPERRRLVRNLPSPVLFSKIRAAERRMEAGEREMGFYLLDLKRRRVYGEAKCSSFRQFVKSRTGTSVKKAMDLVRVRKVPQATTPGPSSSSPSWTKPSAAGSSTGRLSGP